MTYRSYLGGPITGYTNEQWGYPQTFMMSDIAALQTMYGADYTYHSGNTVYSWTPGSGITYVDGVAWLTPGGNRIFMTIWDGGGIDTYDFSAYTTGVTIDLGPGDYSIGSPAQLAYLGGGNYAHGNVYNAYLFQGDARSYIENAIGGSGNDFIYGNDIANDLKGAAVTTLSMAEMATIFSTAISGSIRFMVEPATTSSKATKTMTSCMAGSETTMYAEEKGTTSSKVMMAAISFMAISVMMICGEGRETTFWTVAPGSIHWPEISATTLSSSFAAKAMATFSWTSLAMERASEIR